MLLIIIMKLCIKILKTIYLIFISKKILTVLTIDIAEVITSINYGDPHVTNNNGSLFVNNDSTLSMHTVYSYKNLFVYKF